MSRAGASVDATAEDAYPAEHAWDAMPDEGGEPDAKRQHVGDGHEGEYGGAGAGAAPMTREQAEYAAQLAEWQQAQQAWQEQQAAQAAAAREQMESSLSQLDKVLGAIDGGGAVESGGGGAADGAADGAASADPLAELYSSIAAAKGGDAAGGSAAEGGAAMGAQPAQALEAELPPGVWQSKVPAPWMEYQDPTTGHAYYVNSQTGASQWARPV